MIIPSNDAEKMCRYFITALTDIYGHSLHHIGDGDGINEDEAKEIRDLLVRYRDKLYEDKFVVDIEH